jgi:hypothetical protein
VLVGHSIGSVVCGATVATYGGADAGHMLSLHRNAQETFAAIDRWLER